MSWCFLSCGSKLGVPLELRWVPQRHACKASGTSSLHTSCEGPLGIPLQSLPGPRSSSGVEARASGFLTHDNMDVRVALGFPMGSQASSRGETCMSALLSSWKSSVRLPVVLTLGSVAFYQGTCLSHSPSCFESVLMETVESVAGEPVYLECIGTSGSFELLARPLEFLSSVKLRMPPLELRWERQDSFI